MFIMGHFGRTFSVRKFAKIALFEGQGFEKFRFLLQKARPFANQRRLNNIM